MDRIDPQAALERLGAKVSPDFEAYAAGEVDAAQIRCLLCETAPCRCGDVQFGSPEYLALVKRLHGRTR